MSSVAITIKTIPDIETGKRLHNIQNLSDEGVAKAMFHLQQQKTGVEGLPPYLQRILVIAIATEEKGEVQVELLGGNNCTEKELLEQYVQAVKGKEQVTWSGNVHEFPVLQYRALKHGVKLADLSQQSDLSTRLSPCDSTETPSLSEISHFLKLPNLDDDSADIVWKLFLKNELSVIQRLAKSYVENVYRVFRLF